MASSTTRLARAEWMQARPWRVGLDQLPGVGILAGASNRSRDNHTRLPGSAQPVIAPVLGQCAVNQLRRFSSYDVGEKALVATVQ